MTAPLFYADRIPDTGEVHLEGQDARHGAGALRLQSGEAVLLADGRGRVATGHVLTCDRSRIQIEVEQVAEESAPRPVVVVQAIPKGERGDLAVELLTETGASVIVPWASARTIADWRGKEDAKQQRWQRVARAAAMQSRRTHLPVVEHPVHGIPAVQGQALVLHEQAEESLYEVAIPEGPVTVVVGPEGGLTDEEVAAMRDRGARIVGLGPRVLRTSTAGAAACVWIRGLEMRRDA